MSGSVSTWMGDRLGIPGAVDFFPFFFANNYMFLLKRENQIINQAINQFMQFEKSIIFNQSINQASNQAIN